MSRFLAALPGLPAALYALLHVPRRLGRMHYLQCGPTGYLAYMRLLLHIPLFLVPHRVGSSSTRWRTWRAPPNDGRDVCNKSASRFAQIASDDER